MQFKKGQGSPSHNFTALATMYHGSDEMLVKSMKKNAFAGIVTSLCFLNDSIVLAGHGPYLKVYNVHTHRLLACEHVLHANRLHRIVLAPKDDSQPDSRRLLVFGSKYIATLSVRLDQDSASISVEDTYGPFKDWILDVQWLCEDDGHPSEIAIAYTHNFVEIYSLQNRKITLTDTIQCQVRCMIFTARFNGRKRSDLVLASGTVFNEVHLWKIDARDSAGEGIVHDKLIGHDGVIFGIRFSPTTKQVATVSDDRTIRIWSLEDKDTHKGPQVIYGHMARVWDCQFVRKYLVSISEDRTCCVWRNNLFNDMDDANDLTDQCLASWEGHIGKNVWSCAVSPDHQMIATGGQDSGIRLWSLLSIQNNEIGATGSDIQMVQPPVQFSEDESVSNFCLINETSAIMLTNKGRFLRYATDNSWVLLHEDDDFKGYAVMPRCVCNSGAVIAGGLSGHVITLSTNGSFKPIKIPAHDHKVFEIFMVPSKEPGIFYIISQSLANQVYLHRVDASDPSKAECRTIFKLLPPVDRTTVLSMALSEDEELLICGTRESALMVYRLPNIRTYSGDILEFIPTMQLRRTHGRETVTSVRIGPTKISGTISFWTTGRDGSYVEYRLCNRRVSNQPSGPNPTETTTGIASTGDTVVESRDLVLETVSKNKVTNGWLEDTILVDGELLILGFHRKRFFVHNETKGFKMFSVACGGARRRWQFFTRDAALKSVALWFVRWQMVNMYVRDDSDLSLGARESQLQSNYHGREVRAIRYLDPVKDEPILFATGAEDSILRLHQYHPEGGFVTLSVIRRHRSVIKSIEWSRGIHLLLFTGGGLEELHCWKLDVKSSSTSQTEIQSVEWGKCPTVSDIDIETRIMDMTVILLDQQYGLHLVGVVYSDAMIRIWLFNEKSRSFSMMASGKWSEKCPLQITHAVVKENSILFFVSATDGRVAAWKFDPTPFLATCNGSNPTIPIASLDEPMVSYQMHQSGVNALCVVYDKEGSYLRIISGGDDNALAVVTMALSEDNTLSQTCTCIEKQAHASSITGVSASYDTIFSTSVDQRLNVWKINGDTLKLVAAEYVDVPDPSAMDIVCTASDDIHVSITGIGLQSIRYQRV